MEFDYPEITDQTICPVCKEPIVMHLPHTAEGFALVTYQLSSRLSKDGMKFFIAAYCKKEGCTGFIAGKDYSKL